MPIDTKWFRSRLADAGLSQRKLARQLGLDQSAISLTFAGKRRMKFEEAADIARLLSLPVSEVLRHTGLPIDQGKPTVPLCSIYDGHGESHCIGVEDAERIVPPADMPEGSTAVQCRTAGSPIEHMDGWILFCGPPTQTIPLDQFCRVKIRNGVKVIGVVRRGYKRGRYNISGPAGVITDADIEWIQPIEAIRT
jgi:transcriptional regulator with XRE-family HTH domain